mmetsp:Transcript_5190/g.6139  ORF Transcript_5190/g.6139 Transcript_5190/m.6139 type:complete len:109 (-) Transcript_5190:99-425(-)
MESKEKRVSEPNFTWDLNRWKKMIYKLFKTKTKFCKHQDSSCVMHGIKSFCKNAAAGYCLKFGITVLTSVIKKQKNGIAGILRGAIEKDTFSFGGFVGLVCLISKLCL